MRTQKQYIIDLQYQVAHNRCENAYKKLFHLFYKPLVNFCDTYIGQREVCEDIVSDIFIKVWQMEDSLSSVNNIKVYLYIATKNAAINYLTQVRRYTHVDIDTVSPTFLGYGVDPEYTLIEKELHTRFFSIISKLPPKCRMAYKLVREDGCTYREAGKIMGISEKTIDRHLTIAMRQVAAFLKHIM